MCKCQCQNVYFKVFDRHFGNLFSGQKFYGPSKNTLQYKRIEGAKFKNQQHDEKDITDY